MQVGDLVTISASGPVLHAGKVGVITSIQDPSLIMPYAIVEVTCPDGAVIDGIPHRWIEVISESR